MLKYLVRNSSASDHVKWDVVIPPGYDTYSIESTHGFLFNQISISDQDTIEIDTNLEEQIKLSFIYDVYVAGTFQGIYDSLDDVKFVDQFDGDEMVLIRKKDTSVRFDAYEYEPVDKKFHFVREARFLGSHINVYKEGSSYVMNTSVLYDKLYEEKDFGYGDFYFDLNDKMQIYMEKIKSGTTTYFEQSPISIYLMYIIRLYKSYYTSDFKNKNTFDVADSRSFELNENHEFKYGHLFLKEVISFPKMILNLHDYIENEYDEVMVDKSKTFIKLVREPDPFFIYKSGKDGTIQQLPYININDAVDRGKVIDKSRLHFRAVPQEDTKPITFNSLITTQIRKSKKQTVESVGVQEVKGSSLFDQFIQVINLHLASFLYNYWIGSENYNGIEENEYYNMMYYRCTGMLKFYAGETSNLTNFVNTVVPIYKIGTPIMYGNLLINSSNNGYNDFNNTFMKDPLLAPLFNTESLKLGNTDSRIVYPVGIMKQFLLTGGEYIDRFEKVYKKCFNKMDEKVYENKTIEYVINNSPSPFKIINVKISDPLAYQLLSKKGGDCEIATSASEAMIYNNKITGSGGYSIGNEGLKFAQTVDSLGFFKLWSPELYITVNDSSGLSVCTNVDGDKMISLNNVVWMFTQTATGFNWMSNSLPFSKIDITEGKRLTFTLYDFCGRKLPLIDSSSGLKNDLHLEVTLYRNPQTAQKE